MWSFFTINAKLLIFKLMVMEIAAGGGKWDYQGRTQIIFICAIRVQKLP
jgi:hypothetical protein